MFTFNRKYFSLVLVLLVLEISIALFIKDKFLRPYFGDFLAVILLYCFLKSFFKISLLTAFIFVLSIAFSIELLQFLNITDHLAINQSSPAGIAMGNYFDWLDIVAYILGMIVVYGVEASVRRTGRSITS